MTDNIVLIEGSDLSMRTQNALMQAGFYSLDSIVAARFWDLRAVPNLGNKGLNEVTDWAANHGKIVGEKRHLLLRQLEAMQEKMAVLTRDIADLERRLS